MSAGPAYATWADYCAWKGLEEPDDSYEVPGEVVSELRRASRAVDGLLVILTYGRDDTTGLPTDADMLANFVEATCIQYEYFLETGDPAAAGDYAGVKTQRPGPETVEFLRTEGYLNPDVSTF